MSRPSEGFAGGVSPLVVIAGTGGELLVYNGTPGAGKLIFAVASSNGTDPYGNTFHAGANLLVVPAFGNPGGIAFAINNNFGPPGMVYSATSPGTAGILQIQGQGDVQFFQLDDFHGTATIESGILQWIPTTPGSGNFNIGGNSTGILQEQHGTFSSSFAAQNSTTGTLTFPFTFTNAPSIPTSVLVGSNLDVLLNWQTITTTQATWRLFQKGGVNITGTVIVDWWAVGS